MNFSIIRRTLGWLLLFLAIFFHLPLITAIVCWEKEFFTFLLCIVLSGALGGLCVIKKPKKDVFYAKEGFLIVALSWIVISLIGALPFTTSGAIPNYIDALFETVSGFSTTGASILSGEEIEALPKSLLIWRSFTHWVGGMGVLVLIMAFLPLSGARNMHMLKAESPGPVVGKLVPKIRQTAIILYAIYAGMTLTQFILMLCGGMPFFDAINVAFATAGTGGFTIKASGMAGYNLYVQIVVTVFMLLFSINFNSYYLIGRRKFREAFNTEVRIFIVIVFTAIALITANLCLSNLTAQYSFGEALQHASFYVASIVSTTGFTTENFVAWAPFAQTILLILMFIGACAGSTGGGMKVSRHIILAKSGMHEIGTLLHPKHVRKVTIDKRPVESDVMRSVAAYLVAYICIFVVSLLIISLEGFDFATTFSSVATTLNNVGPGLSRIGPLGNFADFSVLSKVVFMFDMLAGRLEIFPMLILFAPMTWKK